MGLLPPFWVCYCWCWWVLLGLAHARYPPKYSPILGSSFFPLLQPISPSPATMAQSPAGMQRLTTEDQHHHLKRQLVLPIILISVAVALIVASLLFACIYWLKNCHKTKSKTIQGSGAPKGLALGPIMCRFNSLKASGSGKTGSVSCIEYSLLESATSNFSDSNKFGEGGSGCIYKACLNGGVLVAVKKLGSDEKHCEKEFENELDMLSRISHPNIISLMGYSINGQTKFLVYELMQNGSLETQLHGPSRGSALTWHSRMKIALDVARGLEHLHEHCSPSVIHRDLKSSNILLDSDFNAKISDFGIAVIGGSQSKGSSKLSGTLGYVAPEYLLNGELTEKSDVYAFGVVLLELLIGRRPVERIKPSQRQSIVTWAMPQLTDRSKVPNMVDPVIRNTMDLKHLYQVAAIAVLCVQPEPSYRPLITDVLHSLIPLVPIELGGTLRVREPFSPRNQKPSIH